MAEEVTTKTGWIKMRGALLEHPKVILMTRKLHENEDFRQWLTPGGGHELNGQTVSDRALRCVTVSLLLRVWSSSREHGQFVGDDLFVEQVSITDLDHMAGAPGVGDAMKAVGWARARGKGGGVILPRFRSYNAPKSNAERQADFRKRVTGKSRGERYKPVTRDRDRDRGIKTEDKDRKPEPKPAGLAGPDPKAAEVLAEIRIGEPALSALAAVCTADEIRRAWEELGDPARTDVGDPRAALVGLLRSRYGIEIGRRSVGALASVEERRVAVLVKSKRRAARAGMVP